VLKNLTGRNDLNQDMTKTQPKSRQASQAAKPPRNDRISRENGRIVSLGFLAVVLSIAVSFQPLSPLLTTAPVVKPFLRRLRAGKYAAATNALLRWAITVFLSILLCAVFVKDRALSSFPFAQTAAESAWQMIAGVDFVPAGYVYILAGLLAFVGLSAASLGIGACLLASVAIGMAAGGAITMFEHGNNLLLMAFVAIPPWQWAMFAATLLLCVPSAAVGARRLYKINVGEADAVLLKRRGLIAGGLVLLALLCRLALAGPWVSVVRSWTVF
jgi:hypothetical protein